MTEDWRQALDNSLAAGVVFVDFWKAFDTLSHSLSGDLWSWIKITRQTILRYQLLMAANQRGGLWSMRFLRDRYWVLHYFHYSAMTSRIYIAEREGVLQMYVDDTHTQLHPCLTRWQRSLTLSWKSYMNGAAGTNFQPPSPPTPFCRWSNVINSCVSDSRSPRYGSRLSCFALASRFFTLCNDFSTSAFAWGWSGLVIVWLNSH